MADDTAAPPMNENVSDTPIPNDQQVDNGVAPLASGPNESVTNNGGKSPPKGSALAQAAATGVVKLSNVNSGERYNGVEVPAGASFTDGKHFYADNGSVLTDNYRYADGSLNKMSTTYIQQWNENMLNNGVNPMVAAEIVEPYAKMADSIKTFQNDNSAAILEQKAKAISNQKAGMELGDNLAGTVAEAQAKGGPTLAATALTGLASQLGPQAMQAMYPGFKGTPQGAPDDLKLVLARGAKAEQTQQNLGLTGQLTKANIQNVGQNVGLEGAGALEKATIQENTTNLNLAKNQDAVNLLQQFLREGQKGGKAFSTIGDLENAIGDNKQYAALKDYIAAGNLQTLVSNLQGAGRLGQNEVNTYGKQMVNKQMPLETLKMLFGQNTALLTNAQAAQHQLTENIRGVVGGATPALNTAPAAHPAATPTMTGPPLNPKTGVALKSGDITKQGVFMGGDWTDKRNYRQ